MHIDSSPVIPNVSNITTSRTTQTQLVSPVNLTCEATGAPPLTYRWYRDGQLLEGEIRPYLYIPEFSPEDRGNYSCEAINSEGKDESNGALLTIKGKKKTSSVNLRHCIQYVTGVRQYRINIDSQATPNTQSIVSEVWITNSCIKQN